MATNQYPHIPNLQEKCVLLKEYANLLSEYGANVEAIEAELQNACSAMEVATANILRLAVDQRLALREPDSLSEILALRSPSDRVLMADWDESVYKEKLRAALLGRMAGCILGAPVEFWGVEQMKNWADYCNDPFPPVDYWLAVRDPVGIRYGVSKRIDYTRSAMHCVPVDDDITYTLLGLLILEQYGCDFTTSDVGEAWKKYLPYACTAEKVALENLNKGVSAEKAAELDNPYVQWIGADIRADPWGYVAPGRPEDAAKMAYSDAYISHRRNGIYGEMYFAAVISCAFALNDTERALRAGMHEIPAGCALHQDIAWALETGKSLRNHIDARRAVDERFKGMSGVHTNLNACLTIFALLIGGRDFTKVIGECVAMGYDNDCTAATAGSVFGAAFGMKYIDAHWYTPFRNKILTYMNDNGEFCIDDVVDRFYRCAKALYQKRHGGHGQ